MKYSRKMVLKPVMLLALAGWIPMTVWANDPVPIRVTVRSWQCRGGTCLLQVLVVPQNPDDSSRITGPARNGTRAWTLRGDTGLDRGEYMGTIDVDKVELQIVDVKGKHHMWKAHVSSHDFVSFQK